MKKTKSLNVVVSFMFLFATTAISQRTTAQSWKEIPAGWQVSFASGSVRYAQDLVPSIDQLSKWTVAAWKGEKVHTQLLIWGKEEIKNLKIITTELKDQHGNIIPRTAVTTGFIEYVMTDEFKDGCGYRNSRDFDSSLVADRINTTIPSATVAAETVQPVWLSIKVPAGTIPGQYAGTLTVDAGKKYTLDISLTVINKTLPPAHDWKYQLDLWQHPAAIARVHQVKLWSDAHFNLMRKYYTMLAEAGQKNITVSIVNEPWGHQTYDDYPSLIKWTKKKNGTWAYDYSLFDKYVSFVMSCGIKSRINCYSMIPWKIAFTYYDEAQQKEAVFTEAVGTPAYDQFWSIMLTDFTRHLKQKKWFGITTIAMDERPMEAMQSVIALLKKIDPAWKITLAGNYHPEIENDIYDYCIASRWRFPEDVLAKRKREGKISTWYTCCTEPYPNGFSFSPPDEHVWMGWYTAATEMDGYLRWAFNSWTKDPLRDSRFTAWPAGDTYQVYPGPLPSIRFEKMIEGIQDYEKIQLLKKEYNVTQQTQRLNELQAALKKFELNKLSTISAATTVAEVKYLINQ